MKTAIIGFGPHGKRLYQVVNLIPGLILVGVVDGNLDAFAGQNLPMESMFQNTSELYKAHPDIKVVLIATNGPSHAYLSLEAINCGAKYVLVEKPMACSVAECIKMIDSAKKHNVRLAVDKINRHDPVNHLIKKHSESGDWGDLKSIYIQKPGIGLGCLGTHSFDLINYLVGDDPFRVTAWVDESIGKNPRGDQYKDPGGLVIIEYPGGVRGIVSQIEDGAGPQTLEIHFTGARVYHDAKNALLDIKLRDLSVKPGPGKPPVYTSFAIPSDLNVKGDMIAQIEAVVRELISDKPMLVDAHFGKSAMEILAAAHISDQKGNIPINLPLQDINFLNLYFHIT